MRRLCRMFFSRHGISAMLICLEVLLIASFVISASNSWIFLLLAFIVDIITLVAIVNKDANPEYKVTWIVVVLCLPILGTVLYLSFYHRRVTKREEKLLLGIFAEINNHPHDKGVFNMMRRRSPLAAGKARALMNDDPLAEVYTNSSATFFATGEEYFKSLISDLRSAKSFIFLEYFIIDRGELWDEIHGILKEKAKEGVDIRLLYDDIGCMRTLPSRYEKTLTKEGIQTFRFSKVSPRMSAVLNNRDHRKICVIDGKAGYTGGVNIADEYVNKKERFGHWKDGGVRLQGDAVKGLIKQFLSNWDFTARTVSDYEKFLLSVQPAPYNDEGYYIPFGSGPAPIYQRPSGKNAFLNLINQARNYVFITTPYLVIDYDLTQALCNAASRGVDVRIITPGIPDKKKIKIMTQSSYPYLMKSGVKIYEYLPGFIHEKTFVADDKYSVIGTINFDYRSLVHNYENAVWMYASPLTEVAKDEFLKTLDSSELVDDKRAKLSFRAWLLRNGIRLFAPLL